MTKHNEYISGEIKPKNNQDKKQAKQNRQKAAKTKYHLQVVNQLRRNVFNLDLKREIVAALCIILIQ